MSDRLAYLEHSVNEYKTLIADIQNDQKTMHAVAAAGIASAKECHQNFKSIARAVEANDYKILKLQDDLAHASQFGAPESSADVLAMRSTPSPTNGGDTPTTVGSKSKKLKVAAAPPPPPIESYMEKGATSRDNGKGAAGTSFGDGEGGAMPDKYDEFGANDNEEEHGVGYLATSSPHGEVIYLDTQYDERYKMAEMGAIWHTEKKKWYVSANMLPYDLAKFDPWSEKNREYLNTTYAEKDAVKELGAAWDSEAKKWYINGTVDRSKFDKWRNLSNIQPTNKAPNPKPSQMQGQTSLDNDILPVGTRVKAKYRATDLGPHRTHWYDATIVKYCGGDKYDLLYVDGDEETGADRKYIKVIKEPTVLVEADESDLSCEEDEAAAKARATSVLGNAKNEHEGQEDLEDVD